MPLFNNWKVVTNLNSIKDNNIILVGNGNVLGDELYMSLTPSEVMDVHAALSKILENDVGENGNATISLLSGNAITYRQAVDLYKSSLVKFINFAATMKKDNVMG